MKKSPPSIIPLNYDYQKMSPSSTSNPGPAQSDATTSFYDNQYQSLFGDPVPPTPSEDYFGHLDGSLYGSYRRDSYASAIADDFNRTITLATDGGRRLSRLFSQTPITSTSMGLSPRLAPDIQILPDSGSAHSSSDPQASPNYQLLRPDDAVRPTEYDIYEHNQELDSNGVQDYVEHGPTAQDVIRRISDFSEDFKSNVGSLRESPPEIPVPPSRYTRQISNESYSSTEWFKPIGSYPEFTKMPKMRPSSKNVLSIKHLEMPPEDSPVAPMIHDSNGSSSGEDQRKTDPLPTRPPDPQPSRLRSLQRQSSSTDSMLQNNLPPIPPPPLPPAPCSKLPADSDLPQPIPRQKSPVIVTEAITTGADYRVTAPRTHKKTSFTIISEKSPQSSIEQSLQKLPPLSGLSPFRGHGFREPELPPRVESSEIPLKPVAKPRMLNRKSLSSIHLKLPSISEPSTKLPGSDDSPRPSVQFNMSGRRSSMQITPHKGILQKGKDLSSSSQDTPLFTQLDSQLIGKKMKSCEALPLITDPYRTSIPRLSAPPSAPSIPIYPNSNPTRKQRGLLRVINSADSSSRIPVRSNWASMDDLATQRKPILSPLRAQVRRRSSSTSPERRSSTQTEPRSSIASDRRSSNLSSVTTSDFSFRRNSLSPIKTPLTGRRKSIFQPGMTTKSTPASPSNRKRVSRTPRKVAKPTTLSPIIGTPNKDLPPTSPAKSNQHISASVSRRESISKIPIHNGQNGGSRSNSRLSSRGNSRTNSRISSRSNSPYKDFGGSPRLPSSRSPSQQSLRPESRLTSRTGSRPVSRAASSKAPSRSPSRASTRQVSRSVSQANSRASSRPNSRMDQAKAIANSRSNSRLSTRSDSPMKSRTVSPPKTSQRSKSSSRSPVPKKTRRKSISPGKTKTPIDQRRNSKSRIPARIPTSKSPTVSKARAPSKPSVLTRESPNRASVRKSPISAKKAIPSNVSRGGTRGSTKVSSKANSSVINAKRTPTDAAGVQRTSKQTNKTSAPKPAASPTGLKSRQPSNLQSSNLPKNATELKREKSSVRQAIIAAALLKKEASSLSLKKGEGKAEQSSSNQAELEPSESPAVKNEGTKDLPRPFKRQPSTMALLTIGSKLSLLRKRSDSNLSKKLENAKITAEGVEAATTTTSGDAASSTSGKLVAVTKPNVISMTTAAITAQPVEISTVLANQLPKTNSTGQLLAGQEDMAFPASILEKSQKTLENIQKTVTEATDEIHKTINENLTDLKTLESDMGKMSEELTGSPLPLEKSDSLKTVIENRSPKNAEGKTKASASEKTGTVDDAFGEAVQKSPIPATHPIDATVTVINPTQVKGNNSKGATGANNGSGHLAVDEDLSERVSERAISVLPEVDCESANLQSNDAGFIDDVGVISGHSREGKDSKTTSKLQNSSGAKSDGKSKDGNASGTEDIQKEAGSQDPLDEEKEKSKGCCKCGKCKCSSCFCMPCRRSRCSKCFRKNEKDPEAAALASVEVVDEKVSCWKKIKCCKRKPKPTPSTEDPMQHRTMATISEEPEPRGASHSSTPPKQSKCGLCMRKIFCCRSVNKVEAAKHDVEEVKKCCFCIPCRKKQPQNQSSTQPAWEDPERPIQQATEGAAPTPAVAPLTTQGGCCSLFFQKLYCCKKKPPVSDSRRASMKQGIVPPPEETRRKLHVDLVEFNSKMKGAIPVMPLYLAWFCAICNTLVPGLGTLLSGFFCICVGIPRFSMYDSAKARLGSFIINCIVAVAQMFCVLFCFVGWGWSIWWGTIMLKTARKLNKIKKVEKLEEEEEKRQAEMAATTTLPTTTIPATDVEAAKA